MLNSDPYTRDEDTRFTMRINTQLFDKIKEQARLHKRSAAKEIEFMLEEYLRANPTKQTQ